MSQSPKINPDSATLPRAFVHPLWWTALGMLVLNDHMLKGAGLVPLAITGKLSDVAGLIVAPALCAFWLGAAHRRRRMVSTLAVALGFAALKLCPEAATALGGMLGVLGLPNHFWTDPSDLWALLVLPVSYALCRPWPGSARPVAVGGWRRAAAIVGALGCIATGSSGKKASGDSGDAPALRNDTGQPLTLVLASTEGAGGCKLYRADHIGVLTAGAFVAARELLLKSGERAALSEGQNPLACGAASIRFADGEALFVFWRDLDSIASFVPADDPRRTARHVLITGGSGHYEFKVGDDLSRFELGKEPGDTTCSESAIKNTLEWTPLMEAQGFLELSEIRTASDGCYELDWFLPEGDTTVDTQRMCVPKWALPFNVGDKLAVIQEIPPSGDRMLRISRFVGGKLDVQLVIWNDAAKFPNSSVKALEPVDCFGAVSACGAYLRPLRLVVNGIADALPQGKDATLDGDSPKAIRVTLGSGRDVGWSTTACLGPEARLGPTANVLELRTF